jgi:hypothetical protein
MLFSSDELKPFDDTVNDEVIDDTSLKIEVSLHTSVYVRPSVLDELSANV